MAVGRRLFIGAFTAGAVTVAAAEPGTAAADPTTTVFAGEVTADRFNTDSTEESGYFKTTSTTDHAVTVYQAGTSGTGAALNVVSDNPGTSAMYLSGTETGRGTLKIAHRGYTDASDASAAALSIDLQTAGTAAQGIYITSTTGTSTGNSITVRNTVGSDGAHHLEDFVVKGTGLVGIGLPISATPQGQVHVIQSSVSPAALTVQGVVRITDVSTASSSAASKSGSLYTQNGALMWRSQNGTVTQIGPA